MLPPEDATPAVVTDPASDTSLDMPDGVDTIEARLARMEFMLTELYSLVEVAKPAVQQVASDIRDKGAVGLLGMMMGRG